MFVRFVVSVKMGRGHSRRGLFWDIDRPRGHRAEELFAWFNRHLSVPGNGVFRVDGSLCWFKLGAVRHLERCRELLALYRDDGCRGLEIWNRDPGILMYEDEVQIVVRPRHGRGAPA